MPNDSIVVYAAKGEPDDAAASITINGVATSAIVEETGEQETEGNN